tara:strand:- start:80 stop:9709 length:9630 start_codon:yes stop_codon:yes gene_type:complete
MSEYSYQGQPIERERIESAAANLGVSFDEYVQKYIDGDVTTPGFTPAATGGGFWGKPKKFENTGQSQDYNRGDFAPEKQTKFTNLPGITSFPGLNKNFDKNTSSTEGLQVLADKYKQYLGEDGFDFEVNHDGRRGHGIVVEAPNQKTETFFLTVPEGHKQLEDGSVVTDGLVSLSTSHKVHTQQDITNFINENALSLEEGKKLQSEVFKTKRFMTKNFEQSFKEIVSEEELNGVAEDAVSPIQAFIKKDKTGKKTDDILENIINKYEEKYGEAPKMNRYQLEDVFKNIVDSESNKELLDSDNLFKTLYDSYKKGEQGPLDYDDMVSHHKKNALLNMPSDRQRLMKRVNDYKNKTGAFAILQTIEDKEQSEDFNPDDPGYKQLLNTKATMESYYNNMIKKVVGKNATHYIDYNTLEQLDQDFDEVPADDTVEVNKYEITDQVNNYVQRVFEEIDEDDKTPVADILKNGYENHAVSSLHFNSHNKFQTVDFKWNPGMDAGFKDNYIGFSERVKRLGLDYKSGQPIKDVPVEMVLNNWDLFSKFVDNATQMDGKKEIRKNFLGEDLKASDIGGYLKASKQMQVDNVVKDRAWEEIYLLNIDPSSYKRSKSDLYFKGIKEAMPWTTDIAQADATNRLAKRDQLTNDTRINESINLIDQVNNETLRKKAYKPIKTTKKQVEIMSRGWREDFAYQAGGFTPMLAEFAAVGGITTGLLRVSQFGNYLNKINTLTYATKTAKGAERLYKGANVTKRANAAGFDKVDDYIAMLNRGKTAGQAGFMGVKYGQGWQKGVHLMTYAMIEEGKMQSLDPLFGTEMPLGMGTGFYLGGRLTMPAMQFGSRFNLAGQKISRVLNPVFNKMVKPGVSGATAAELALPLEWALDNKSFQRHMEETYPDMDTFTRRYTTNLALFSILGLKSMKGVDYAHTFGLGDFYTNKFRKQAMSFRNALYDKNNKLKRFNQYETTREVENTNIFGKKVKKKYTKEQLESNYEKYTELYQKSSQMMKVAEKVPLYFNPEKNKKHYLELAKNHGANKPGAKGKGFEVKFIEGGRGQRKTLKGYSKNGEPIYKTTDAYFIDGKDLKSGKSQLWLDPKKMSDGQFPHEVYHHLTKLHLENTGEFGTEAKLDAAIQNHIQKTLTESSRTDLDFMKFINENYDMTKSRNIGEISANLIELLNTAEGRKMFISNNLFSDIAFEFSKFTEQMFLDKDGNVTHGMAGKFFVPKLDVSDPKTLINFLARLDPGKSYNPNMLKRLEKAFEGIELNALDGKLYKDGVIVSASAGIVKRQQELRDMLNPIILDFKAGKITKEQYLAASKPLVDELADIRKDEATRQAQEKLKEYKETVDETNSERKQRVNSNYHNHKNVIRPPEGVKLSGEQLKENRKYIFDIVESYRSLIVRAGQGKFDTPTYENMSLKQKKQFVFENTQTELIKHIERFKESEQRLIKDKTGEITGEKDGEYVDFDAYINSYVARKEGTATKKVSKKTFSEDLDKGKNVVVEPVNFQNVEISKFENGLVLKDVLDFSKFPDAVKTIKKAGQEKISKIKAKGEKFYTKFLEREAGKLTGYTYRDVVDIVPGLVKSIVSPKEAINKYKNNLEKNIEDAEQAFKDGNVTEARLKEIKAENNVSKSDIELIFQAKYIVDNLSAVRTAASSNVSPITGKWTGLPKVMMTRKLPSGETVQVLYEPAKRVTAEKTTKKLSEKGLKKGGNTAGNRKQTKKRLTDIEYLDVLGIKENIDGSIDISKALSDRGLKETLIPRVLGEVTKALENQIANDLIVELKADASVRALQNLKRIQTKMRAGKDPGLASAKIAEEAFKEIALKYPEKSIDAKIQMFHDFDKSFKKDYPATELRKGVTPASEQTKSREKIMEVQQKISRYERVFTGKERSVELKEGEFEIFNGFAASRSGNVASRSVMKQAKLKGFDTSKITVETPLTERVKKYYATEYRPWKNRLYSMTDPMLLNSKEISQTYRFSHAEGDGKSIKKALEENNQVDLIRADQGKKDILDNTDQANNGAFDIFIKTKEGGKLFKNGKEVLEHYKTTDNAEVMNELHVELGKPEYSKILEPSMVGARQRKLFAKKFGNEKLSGKGDYEKTAAANRLVLEYKLDTVDRLFNELVKEGQGENAINMTSMFYEMQTSAGGGIVRSSATHNALTLQRAFNLPQKVKKGAKIGKTKDDVEEFRGELIDIVSEGYRSEHEFQASNFSANHLISHITGKFKQISPSLIDVFNQSVIPRYVQKLIDKNGNTSSVYDLPGMGDLKISAKTEFFLDNIIMETTLDVLSGRTYAEISNSKFNDLKVHDNIAKIINGTKILKSAGLSKTQMIKNLHNFEKAVREANKRKKKSRGMSTFDFDETVGFSENYVIARKGKETKRIASNEWPFVGEKLVNEGWKMDFTDFNRVTDGKPGPLMQKMKNQIKKFGPENVFILTARAPESQKAIYDYLLSEGIKIPYKNITGLGNSTGEAKAMWMLEKFAEGYNDMYFVDDALPNVKAVKDVLSQLDIKSKVQIVRASENISKDFNKILEDVKGVEAFKTFSEAKAQRLGSKKGRYKFFGTPGSEDFSGLVTYAFAGKGKKGEGHKKFFEEKLHNPYNRAFINIHKMKQSISTDYKALLKQMPDVRADLNKTIEGSVYTFDQAVRVDRFTKAGYEIPGLSEKDKAFLLKVVREDAELSSFSTKLAEISKQPEGWLKPKDYWLAENITSDLNNVVDRVYRQEVLTEFKENREQIFGKWENGRLIGENMNKIEALYGKKHRDAIDNMVWRMENFTNRGYGTDATTAKWMNWINNASSTIMFFNQKSAMLQTISNVNYLNGKENNPFAAAKAFANQPQYWKDFIKIMNSDMLVQRRAGLKINVEAAEIVERVAGGKNTMGRMMSVLLEKGFIPTKYADSFAISLGGATYYRNRIKMYEKQGLSAKEADAKAWEDFSMLTEKTQQSSRPDLVSQQQASALGRPILSFANTPMQMFRRHKRRLQDIANNRGSLLENVLSSVYYGAVQTMIFSYFSNAMFSFDEDDGKRKTEKEQGRIERLKGRYTQTIVDSYLRGMGVGGAALSAIKNSILTLLVQKEKSQPKYYKAIIDLLNVSPPIGSKVRKLDGAGETFTYNKRSIAKMDWYDINNPGMYASAQVVSAFTNAPADRLVLKALNIQDASNSDFENWQRIAMGLGFNKWNLGLENKLVKRLNKKIKKPSSVPFSKQRGKGTLKMKRLK